LRRRRPAHQGRADCLPRQWPPRSRRSVFRTRRADRAVGPADGRGEESFDLTVCSPEWLGLQCPSCEPVIGLHHLIVGWDTYDGDCALRQWLEARVQATEAETWDGVAEQLRILGKWEFDGYRR
jgi:hypothetical protein